MLTLQNYLSTPKHGVTMLLNQKSAARFVNAQIAKRRRGSTQMNITDNSKKTESNLLHGIDNYFKCNLKEVQNGRSKEPKSLCKV